MSADLPWLGQNHDGDILMARGKETPHVVAKSMTPLWHALAPLVEVRQNLSYLDLKALRMGAEAALTTGARKEAQDLIAVIDAIAPIYPKDTK
jgi:hypothetical protein